METIPYWKNIYKNVIRSIKSISVKNVTEVLKSVEKEIKLGILQFEPYTSESYGNWRKKIKATDNRQLEVLIHKVGKSLNLDCTIAYSLFCNYVMFEYYGKVDDIVEVAKLDQYTSILLLKLWHFYTSERMYLLKTIRFILENHQNDDQQHLKTFMSNLNMKEFTKYLLKQLQFSINEIHHKNSGFSINIQEWVERNHIEKVEIVVNLIFAMEIEKPQVKDVVEMLNVFHSHGFGLRPPDFFEGINLSKPEDLKLVGNIECAALFIGLKQFWDDKSWFSNFKELEKVMKQIANMPEYSAVSMAWCMLIMSLPNGSLDPKYDEYVQNHIGECFNDTLFVTLSDIANIPFIKGLKLERFVKEGLFSFFNQICKRSSDHFVIYVKIGSIDLLVSLLEIKEIADKVLDGNYHVHYIFATAMNMFPFDFDSFSLLCETLYRHEEYREHVINAMLNIEVYTNENLVPLPNFKNFHTYREGETDIQNFTIPKNSSVATIQWRPNITLVQYRGDFRYSYLHYVEEYTSGTLDLCEMNIDENRASMVARAVTGLNLLVKVMDSEKLWNNVLFVNSINYAKFFMSKGGIVRYSNSDLIDACFKICLKLLVMPKYKMSIIQLFAAINCLHPIPKEVNTIEQLLKLNVVDDSKPLQLAMQVRYQGKYNLINTYIDFLKMSMVDNFPEKFQLRGIIFLLRHVFPQHQNWKYEDPHEKTMLSQKILMHLFEVLQMYSKPYESQEICLTYNFCVEIIFNYEPFIRAFNALFRISNNTLEKMIYSEPNWQSGKSIEVIKNIRLCMSIMLFMFNLKSMDEMKATKFWKIFLYNGIPPNIVKVIVDYMLHKFDLNLPKLACRLLKKISMNSTIPILSSLEIDNHQVQCMFLERLRDVLEEEDMKVALLDMIATCTKSQNGMTVAFFNLPYRKKVSSTHPFERTGESIIDFMSDYLKNLTISSEYLRSPLQAAMLKLFHAIWVEKKTILVKELVHKEKFWPVILGPLLENYTLQNETYSQILDILAIEISKPEINFMLESFLKKIFIDDRTLPSRFPDHLNNCLLENALDEYNIKLLLTWKKFLVFLAKSHDKVLDVETKKILTRKTINGFVNYIQCPDNVMLIKDWSDLYLYLITKWGEDCYGDLNEDFKTISNAFVNIKEVYDFLTRQTRETIISIAIKSLQHFDEIMKVSNDEILRFLKSIGHIIEKEYERFQNVRDKSVIKYSEALAWVLLITFGNKLFVYKIYDKWFFFTQFFSKVVATVGILMSCANTIALAKIATNFLTDYVKTSMSQEFLYINFQQFYDSISPPPTFYNFSFEKLQDKEFFPWDIEEFWISYTSLINMNISLMDKFGYFMFHPMLEFMNLHITEIITIVKLPQYTVNTSALKLVSNTLKLCNFLFKWKRKWLLQHEPLITGFYKIIAECLNSCISIVLSPKVMKMYKIGENQKLDLVEKLPVEFLVSIMDRIVEIISSSCMCLIELSPKMVDLLGQYDPSESYFNGFDYEFHIPNPNNPHDIKFKLTFGGVLCLVHYLCKTLLQILKGKTTSKYISTATLLETQEDSTSVKSDSYKSPYVVLVYPDYIGATTAYDKFNSIQRFANSEIYSLAAPWLSHMNKQQVVNSLEILNTLLATHIFKAIVDNRQHQMQLQLLKRDLCSELQFFHDFVRKKFMDQHKYTIDGNMIIRNKNFSQKIEEDSEEYLLMLSHWFMVVCQLMP